MGVIEMIKNGTVALAGGRSLGSNCDAARFLLPGINERHRGQCAGGNNGHHTVQRNREVRNECASVETVEALYQIHDQGSRVRRPSARDLARVGVEVLECMSMICCMYPSAAASLFCRNDFCIWL